MKEQLITIVKEALDLEGETVTMNDSFDRFDTWDSLGKLSLIALIDEHFDLQLSDDEFNSFETIEDLYNALEAKKS
ncbi:acyl carrier protein [Xanthomarina sp. F1114]|uniref:acyl carrier protein n=1 Tax=Xanthomarina sp. F1114 TaxID=2996019 RepID=UPI00225DEBCF|nr:acyl carrier protein [Xanthomarina sp. F1114]MCX7548869.1 acyl carrier protein [Xanthomarina sp. F1114]